MLELLAAVILVAIFFGVSLTTALYGIIQTILIIIALSTVVVILTPFAERFWEWFNNVPEQKPKLQEQPKLAKKRPRNAKRNNIIGWIVVFVLCFLITGIILLATDVINTSEWQSIPIYVRIFIPHLPFVAILATSIIKNQINKKRASKKR